MLKIWNWKQENWPRFTWDGSALEAFEKRFLHDTGMFLGVSKHFDATQTLSLTIDLLTDEALNTSEIEGEYLNRDSVQSSIRRHFGLQTDHRRAGPAEYGVAEMMIDLYEHHHKPLSHDTLFEWHKMITNGRRDLTDIGRYRTHQEAMQVISGRSDRPKIHFEAPPSRQMQAEMNAFIDLFHASAPGGDNPLPPLTRAGLVHLYFVSVHPFEDGNGRIGRALVEKTLSEALGRPCLGALSHIIRDRRKAYYDALERNNASLEITDWLVYFAEVILEAQDYTQKLTDFILQKTKLFDRLRDRLNERQQKVLERMFREGPKGFTGGLSAENYVAITGASRATATRDLQHLVEIGALLKTGAFKTTRYRLPVTQ